MISGAPRHVVVLPRPSWLPLYAGLAMSVFFLCFLTGLYWAAPAGLLLALCVFLRWAWVNGERHDPPLRCLGDGAALPLHHVAKDAPGWLGLIFTLVADGTLLASLLFGYVYLLLIAPGPPPVLAEPALLLPAATAAALLLLAILPHMALAANRRGAGRTRTALLVAAALAELAATGLAGAAAVMHLPPPTVHAASAIAAVGMGYLCFHTGLAMILAGFAAARAVAGFVSPLRNLDLRILALWADYTAVAGLALLAAVFGVPALEVR